MSSPNLTRRYWARRLIDKARGVEIPSYGSTDWLQLPEGDPVKIASVVVAAECWAGDGDDLEADLHREISSLRWNNKRVEDDEYAEQMQAHRERWPAPKTSSFGERRRRQLEDAEPRPNDFGGGPADWSGGDAS